MNTIAPDDTGLGRAVGELPRNAEAWSATPPTERIDLPERLMPLVRDAGADIAEVAARAKGYEAVDFAN
ncbi:hypothetical protein ABZ557_17715 [Streptomyces sp. NPDC019645]|uniref:hypothetical protein n=1 Tax=Streptomyces sp. NPDC019645 TaxID=3154786 RepID=UPI0033DF9E6F